MGRAVRCSKRQRLFQRLVMNGRNGRGIERLQKVYCDAVGAGVGLNKFGVVWGVAYVCTGEVPKLVVSAKKGGWEHV